MVERNRFKKEWTKRSETKAQFFRRRASATTAPSGFCAQVIENDKEGKKVIIQNYRKLGAKTGERTLEEGRRKKVIG